MPCLSNISLIRSFVAAILERGISYIYILIITILSSLESYVLGLLSISIGARFAVISIELVEYLSKSDLAVEVVPKSFGGVVRKLTSTYCSKAAAPLASSNSAVPRFAKFGQKSHIESVSTVFTQARTSAPFNFFSLHKRSNTRSYPSIRHYFI